MIPLHTASLLHVSALYWPSTIRNIVTRETEVMDWCKLYYLAHDRDKRWTALNMVRELQVPQNGRNFLTGCKLVAFHGLCSLMLNYWLKHTKLNKISYGRLWRLDIISAVTLCSLVVPTVKSEEPPCLHLHLYPQDGGRMFLSNNSTELRDHGVTSQTYSTLHLVLTTSRICDLTLAPVRCAKPAS